MAMAWEWYQRLPAGLGGELERAGGHAAATTGEPSSSVPSTLGRNEHAVPVHELRSVGVVDDLNGDRLAFAHAQHRPGRGAVVADGGDECGSGRVRR